MRNIMIIGAGGIGSYLVDFLSRINTNEYERGKRMLYDITVYDSDVVESKNLGYQNYSPDDVGRNKSDCLADKYRSVNSEPFDVLVESQLSKNFDLIVCCVDNLATRRLVYKLGFGNAAKVKWLDLRSQGRNAALFSYKAEESMLTEALNGEDGSFSCQASDWNGTGKQINTMHMVIAAMGAQWIQRWFVNNDDVAEYKVVNI